MLREQSEKIACHLVQSGIQKGDRVAIYMSSSWQSIVSIYGATMAGAAFLIINPQTKNQKLKYILEDSGAKILLSESFLSNEFFPATEGSTTIREMIITGKLEQSPDQSFNITDFEYLVNSNIAHARLPLIIPNDLAALIYTSGSTGFPKGVMMTHQSMVFASWSIIEYLRLNEDDRIMLLLPLAFDYGLYQLLMSVTIGGTLIVEQSFIYPATVYQHIEEYRPTVFPGVPTIYAMMIASAKKNPLSFNSITRITNTAAALPADFIPALKKIFPHALVFKMYGLTECKRVCYLEPELIDRKSTSVGKAIPGTEVFLLSPEGKPVPPGVPGILHIRGPHIMLGYWNNETLSNQMLKQGTLPCEKILTSNDWFIMDEEGFLYFQGRNDDIIKTRGEKVSPVEIENIIYNISGVREVAVIGIPDPILGEAIVAFVTKYEASSLSEKEILKKCMMNLESFMVPQKIIFLTEMPKNTNGKFDKHELKKKALPL
jgi:acyl-CoA synthetase (AMP-forming)/AMP-acid ligase II